MYTVLVLSALSVLLVQAQLEGALDSFYKERESMIEDELAASLGGNLTLSSREISANQILMREKYKEFDFAFQNPSHFNFSRLDMTYRNHIGKSPVYSIMKRMPKGAALHVHSSLMMDAEYMMQLTYEDDLYVCNSYGKMKLQFADGPPALPCPTSWRLLSEVRKEPADKERIDNILSKEFKMDYNAEDDINKVWDRFQKAFRATKMLLLYRPVREKFFYDALKKFYDDNILYIEIRSGLDELYEKNGTVHDKLYLARMYQKVASKFASEHPDFIGVKTILSVARKYNIKQVRDSLSDAVKLKEEMPDFIAGFDLVGQEDLGKPLADFIPALIEVKDKLDLYLHAGETNWFGTSSDENIVDAILLGTKRIGHGYALIKHPILMDAVRKREIAIEVNVISNVVLNLVEDVRNHPLASYLALGLPVVLSSDDPGVWSADALSDDFYVTFMGVASRRADIRTLKQLALNSIRYSALSDAGKSDALRLFNEKWDKFVDDLIESETTQ
ncbi:hypothetical protein JYU34_011879 [Plutella xylostella]|uniref:adenosine deaminase n=1 Tax=Plutella xylostella TaxID=51655 RepID=A0ABQ7QDY9_PLUXY|nr:hypothetical protein JYU34_011879 [Plutella xylostella]